MGLRNDVSQSFDKSGSEATEALLEKSYSEQSRESIDSDPQVTVVQRVPRRATVAIVLGFAIFNVVGLAVIYFLLAGRLTGPSVHPVLPPREYETVEFYPQHLKPGPETDEQWEADGPTGGGYLVIENPEDYGLPRGIKGGNDHNRYGLTWAHQYHCLMKLRVEFWEFVGNSSMLIGKPLDDNDPDSVYLWHLAHCFDYLKQSILCSMDMTVEYPTRGGAEVLNGYEIPHQCTKRSVYDAFMNDHGYYPEDVPA